jgi:predicted transcriptional regulator
LKERLIKQHWPTGLQADFMVIGEFADQVGDLRNGGSEKLARQIQSRGYRLVVIDTLSRSIIGDQNDTQAMTAALTPIQEIAHTHNCAVMLVDHHNKMAGGDAITDILGSTAKGAMVDTAWGIYRERGKSGAKLSITGREVEERTLAIVMDWTTGCWQCEGDADKIQVVDRHQALLDVLADIGPTGIVEISELLSRNKGPVYKDIQDLVNEGLIRKTGRGRGNIRYELIEDDVQR